MGKVDSDGRRSGTVRVTDYIDADIHDPAVIVREAARTLDFSQPVGLMLVGIINFILDDARARAIVAELMAAFPSGSYLTIQHPASEDPGMVECIRRWNQHGQDQLVARPREEITRYLDGLELLEPGVVTLNEWRPDDPTMAEKYVPSYAAMGRKP
jgi:S-adenosyl methyltransferase